MEPTAPVLFLLGASHHTAPLAVREKLALDEARAAALAAQLQSTPGVREFAFLNTCNRVEVYGVATAASVDRLAATVGEVTGCTAAELTGVLTARHGHNVLEHLFAVAAGLDSQVVGETEILGQVKTAYDAALARHWTGPVLNRVFQKGFQAAKHVRTTTAITEGQVSVANVAVDLALNIFGGLKEARILLLGAGEIGEKTAKAFQSRGAAALTVANRRFERAMELATALA
ncbi:MAG: glutamyl-tRNA reductase, partial [Opitutus sp.]